METWRVYLVECADGTWYTGVARDIDRRIDAHNRGKGARYTRGRGPVTLLAASEQMTQGDALRLERSVKALPRSRKLAAVRRIPETLA